MCSSDLTEPRPSLICSSAAKSTGRLPPSPASVPSPRCELTRPSLFPRHRLRPRSLIVNLIRRPRPLEDFLKLVESVGPDGASLSANHNETKWTIEHGELRLTDCTRKLFRKSKSGYPNLLAVSFFNIVVYVYL